MATTGTVAFDLNLNEIVEEAFERAGSELRSGYDLRTARRSLNILLIEWQNSGLNMWTMEEASFLLQKDRATYDLPADTVDIIEHVIRTQLATNQTDLSVNRISVSTYANIPNKLSKGKPNQIFIERKTSAEDQFGVTQTPRVTFYPIPDQDYYMFVYWRMRRIQDAGTGISTHDIPFRFLPCLVAGLAYYLAMKIPEAISRVDMLRAAYAEQWQVATNEDREKTTLMLKPRVYS